ncbi:MAG: hypothetical protein GVY19_02085 [Bacteroidetes bacterium]|jgi:outer membrane protein assembly factor BamB|nr:hypothetical protein [Bacteroidota bacterium]
MIRKKYLYPATGLGLILLLISSFDIPAPESGDPRHAGQNNVEVIIPSFLGGEQRNYYGNEAPDKLNVVWRRYLGKGETIISRSLGSRIWAGAGFTGQPLLVNENGKLYIIQGAYDHHLKKMDAQSGKIVWQYKFDDVVKGTGTIWVNDDAEEQKNKIVILQGSRLGIGNYLDSKYIPSFRAISYYTGEELWRLNVKWTDSYSRDVDGSALVVNDTGYIGLENSLFTVFDPDYRNATFRQNMIQPQIFKELKLYKPEDVEAHNHNVVTECSPTLMDRMIYIPSGSGRVWGYDMDKQELTWEFYIGSDIDGSAPLTNDKCILVSVEKQYIEGQGGVFKLNPKVQPQEAALWYFPTQNNEYSSWEGGIVGSPCVNDRYPQSKWGKLAAFVGIDGYLYVVRHDKFEEGAMVLGPDNDTYYKTPELIFKRYVGPSISTPIFVKNKLVVGTYNGLHLFSYDEELNFILNDKIEAPFEATPVAHNGKIYIASRNGYFYCLGD